jgi:hypothetical protein
MVTRGGYIAWDVDAIPGQEAEGRCTLKGFALAKPAVIREALGFAPRHEGRLVLFESITIFYGER